MVENTSKALIIVAEILIGVVLLTLMVFTFRALGSFSDAVDYNIQTKNINEFNIRFEKYRGRNDLTAQDIITIGNLAKQYNMGFEEENLPITINVLGVESKYAKPHKITNELTYEFIKKYSNEIGTNEMIRFECKKEDMDYDKITGKINKIVLKKLE